MVPPDQIIAPGLVHSANTIGAGLLALSADAGSADDAKAQNGGATGGAISSAANNTHSVNARPQSRWPEEF
jgi:hypothetical protein